jgi:hypothetical protein
MPKLVSAKQRLANRRNAQQSTGPNTARAKARSSRNALKHGLLAQDVVVDTPHGHERQADFDALLADLVAELKPQSIIEQTLVERIATCYWRLRRAQRFEVGAIRGALQAPDPFAAELEKNRRTLDETTASLQLECRLAELLETPAQERSSEEAAELQHSLADFAEARGLTALGLEDQALEDRARDMLPPIIAALDRNLASLRAGIEDAERQCAARGRHQNAWASLPCCDAFLRVVRYETMLDRQIHRALAELRRFRQVPRHDTKRKKYLQNEPI